MAERTAEVARITLGEDYFRAAESALKAPLIVLRDELIWSPAWERSHDELIIDTTRTKCLSLVEAFTLAPGQVRERLIPFTHLQGISSVRFVGSNEAATIFLKEEQWI
jgi:hypothetical protein